MESVTEVVLLKSGKLTSGGGIPSGELISSGEENMILGIFWMLLLLGDFPCECLRELLTARATCLDPGVGQILTTTITFTPTLKFFLHLRLHWKNIMRLPLTSALINIKRNDIVYGLNV